MRPAVLLLVLTCAAGGDDGDRRIRIGKDLPLTDFLATFARECRIVLVYDPDDRRIAGQQMGAGFSGPIGPDGRFDTCRAILAFYEIELDPAGPRGVFLAVRARDTRAFVLRTPSRPAPRSERGRVTVAAPRGSTTFEVPAHLAARAPGETPFGALHRHAARWRAVRLLRRLLRAS